jgi:glycerol-3-phosphate dehydrogenase
MSKIVSKAVLLTSILMASSGIALAEEAHVAPIKAYVAENVMNWANDPVIIEAIRKQNEEHAGLDQAKIDELDKEWRAQATAADKPLITEVLGRDVSTFLSGKKDESAGMITELFVMDNKGLNVGQSDVTSDYWQGDEAKWQDTYLVGPEAIFVDEVEQDESTQALQSQASMTIVDPDSGEPIGAITIGINLDQL